MKKSLKASTLLLVTTCVSVNLPFRASADSTADLIISMKCQGGYNVNIWKKYSNGEFLYRSTSSYGNLSLGKGTRVNTGSAKVYKFKNGKYEYQVLSGTRDHKGQGSLEVYKNGRSIMSQTCTQDT